MLTHMRSRHAKPHCGALIIVADASPWRINRAPIVSWGVEVLC